MKLSRTSAAMSAVFDDPNLVSSAGLVPVVALAEAAGLRALADEHLTVPSDKGANAGSKVTSLVAGMVAGADSDDMGLLRQGGMGRVFARAYAPSTLGSFLRAFTFGHVRQLDAVASRLLIRLATQAPLLRTVADDFVLVDVDDTIVEVHGYAKQGAGFGYSGVRGLNALLATATTAPSDSVAMGNGLAPAVHPRVRATRPGDHLTTQPTRRVIRNDVEHPDSEVRPPPTPSRARGCLHRSGAASRSPSVDRG